MQKFKNLSLFTQSSLIYIFTIIISVFLSPVFGKFYMKFYKPNLIGSGMFVNLKTEVFWGGIIVGYILILSFLVFLLIKNKQWTVWGIGVFIPMLISIGNGGRYIFWASILSAVGWLLAQAILKMKKEKREQMLKKFKNLSLIEQAIRIYILSLFFSLLFYFPFYKLYIFIFHPIMVGGDSLFMIYPAWFEWMVGITIFAWYFFLPFFVFLLIKKKRWTVWGIGVFIPMLISIGSGGRYIFWASILSAVGWLLAQAILKMKKVK